MNTTRNVLVGTAIVIVTVCALIFLQYRKQDIQLEVSYADLQAALDKELVRSSDVGFLPRVRFSSLRVRFDDGVVFEGTGNWFSIGAGSFTLPNITIVARLPTETNAWSVSNGIINISDVEIIRAFREPFGTIEGGNESDANVRGWQDKMTEFVQRLEIFKNEKLVSGHWRVVSVQSRAESLTIILEN